MNRAMRSMIRKFSSGLLSLPLGYDCFQHIVGGTSARLKAIKQYVGAKPGDRILDIGCGPGGMVQYFPQAYYFGFDPDPEYIRTARSHYGDRATFHCGRVSTYALELDQQSSFDLVLAFGVIHHLDDQEAVQLFKLASSALKPTGRLITIDGCYHESQGRWARTFLSWDRGRYVRNQPGYLQLASQVFPAVSSKIHHDWLKIPYTLIILECVR